MSHERIEWGLRLDCSLQGCDPPHGDNGRVITFEDEVPAPDGGPIGFSINNHAAVRVSRKVSFSSWEES
jgi:hypothetical protein